MLYLEFDSTTKYCLLCSFYKNLLILTCVKKKQQAPNEVTLIKPHQDLIFKEIRVSAFPRNEILNVPIWNLLVSTGKVTHQVSPLASLKGR